MVISPKAFEFVMFGSALVAALAASEGKERLSLVAQLTTFASAFMALLTAEEILKQKKAK